MLCIKRLCPWRFGILGFKGKKKKRSLAMLKNLPWDNEIFLGESGIVNGLLVFHLIFVTTHLCMYNTNGFRTKTMYDYYIVMKSMFFVVKLSSHLSIGYASFTILLPWSTHKLHQNYSKPKAFPKSKFQFSQTMYSYHNFVQNEGVFQGHKHLLIY